MRKAFVSCVAAFLVLVLSACSTESEDQAAAPEEGAPAAPATASVDQDFVRNAASAGLADVTLSRMAVDRAYDPAVAEYGRWLIEEHEAANAALARAAREDNIPVRQALSPAGADMVEELDRLTGSVFDRFYLRQMINGHERTIDLYETYLDEGESEALRDYADGTVSMLEDHRREAEELRLQLVP